MGKSTLIAKAVTSKAKQRRALNGIGQLTLVEHALCPLGTVQVGGEPLSHRTSFQYVSKNGKRETAHAAISAAFGLFPGDEFFLWGLLGLTFG